MTLISFILGQLSDVSKHLIILELYKFQICWFINVNHQIKYKLP